MRNWINTYKEVPVGSMMLKKVKVTTGYAVIWQSCLNFTVFEKNAENAI
jgi:hypothetical protein